MNFSFYVLEFLKKHGRVTIPGFGTFALKILNATFDRDGKNMLPPAAELTFDAADDDSRHDFADYLAKARNTTPVEAELEIRKQVNYWNAALEKNQTVMIEGLGTFHLQDSQLLFSGAGIENLSPAFFGLEEINLSAVKKGRKGGARPYRFARVLLWSAVVLIIGGAIAYLGVLRPELLFGKASFINDKAATTVKTVPPAPVVPLSIDSTTIHTDSLQTDSAAAIPVVAPKSSTKKSTPPWKKSKKRRNH